MDILILLAAALLPAILLWIYIWKQDAQPEPTNWLAKAVLYGIGIGIPVVLLEMVIESILFAGAPTTLFGTTMKAFFVAALPRRKLQVTCSMVRLAKESLF